MARGTLTAQELTYNGGTVNTIGGTIVQADGALIRAGGNTRKLFLHCTAGTIAGTLTIVAGDNPPAFRKSLGDLAVALTANRSSSWQSRAHGSRKTTGTSSSTRRASWSW